MTPVGQCLPDLAAHCFDMFYPQWEEGEGARGRKTSQFERKCVSQNWDVLRSGATFAGSIRSCQCSCEAVPQVPLNAPACVPTHFTSNPKGLLFSLSVASLTYQSSFSSFATFLRWFLSRIHPDIFPCFIRLPFTPIHLLSLSFPSSPPPVYSRHLLHSPQGWQGGREGGGLPGKLNASTMAGAGPGCLAVSNDFSWLVFSAVWGQQDTFS